MREAGEREPTSRPLSLIAATRTRVTLYVRELRKPLRDLHLSFRA